MWGFHFFTDKMVVRGGLRITEKRKDMKGKGEKGKIYPSECRLPKNSRKR